MILSSDQFWVIVNRTPATDPGHFLATWQKTLGMSPRESAERLCQPIDGCEALRRLYAHKGGPGLGFQSLLCTVMCLSERVLPGLCLWRDMPWAELDARSTVERTGLTIGVILFYFTFIFVLLVELRAQCFATK